MSKSLLSSLGVKERHKKVRQEVLREQLAAKGLAQQAIESIEKIEKIKIDEKTDKDECQLALKKIEAQNYVRFRLLAKILPDLKQVEITEAREKQIADIKKIHDDLEKIEQGQTIDSTSREITDE